MAENKPNDSKELAKELLRQFSAVEGKRRAFDPLYAGVAKFAGPAWLGFNNTSTHPQEQDLSLLDSTLKRCVRIYGAGMMQGSCPANDRWFGVEFEDPDLQLWVMNRKSGAARAWIQRLEDSYYADLWNGGFYPQREMGFRQFGLFGWDDLYVDEEVLGGIRFNSRPLHECFFDANFNGKMDRHFRKFNLTARDIKAKFGESNLPDSVKHCLDSAVKGQADTPFEVVHVVIPKEDCPDTAKKCAMPYASFYVLSGDGAQVLSEGGYQEMPYLVTRAYRLPNTPYCYSPGTEAVADVRTINEIKRLILEHGQLSLAPPILVPDDGFLAGPLSYKPRAINYYRKDGNGNATDVQPMPNVGDPRFDMELLNSTRSDIEEAFYVSLFLTMNQRIRSGTTPTKAEVLQLAGERDFLLAPMLTNIQADGFNPLFDRMWALKMRRGEIPPPPEEIVGRNFKVVLKSALMKAQTNRKIDAFMATLNDALPMSQIDPSILQNFDLHSSLRMIADQRGCPQECLRDAEEVTRQVDDMNRQAVQRQGMDALERAAGQYPGLSKAPEQGSPGEALLKQIQGGS